MVATRARWRVDWSCSSRSENERSDRTGDAEEKVLGVKSKEEWEGAGEMGKSEAD